jgi:large subunit ribosomal protein L31
MLSMMQVAGPRCEVDREQRTPDGWECPSWGVRLEQCGHDWHTVWLTTRLRFTSSIIGRPGGHNWHRTTVPQKGTTVKDAIHPEYVVTEVTCSCGNSFTTRSTAKSGAMHAEVCSACHPFYTGKQKIMDVGGRVDKFEKRYGKRERTTA